MDLKKLETILLKGGICKVERRRKRVAHGKSCRIEPVLIMENSIGSIILAVLGVAARWCLFCVAYCHNDALSRGWTFSRYVTAGIIALCGYLGRCCFPCLSITISHSDYYYTARSAEEYHTKLGSSIGRFLDTVSQYKTTIVDRVEV